MVRDLTGAMRDQPPTVAPAPSGLAVRLDDVGVRFASQRGAIQAVDGLQLEVEPGSFTAVIGPNGCGKSTLLRVVAGLLAPSVGSVSVGDAAPRPGDGRVGLAFQQPRLIPWRSTLDNAAMPLELAGVPAHERRDRAVVALQRVGLASAAGLRPAELSGGMAQRAAIARALVLDPPVLLLDEPTAALDLGYQLEIAGLLLELNRQRQLTIVISTHDLAFASSVCRELVLLRDGRVLEAGSVEQVLTERNIRALYDVEADVSRDAVSGRILVMPRRHVR